ncbi:hypothetical protein [Cylindrospermopsis raciborskii]|nr:hypothetical protein [Cylindrospermopsis raciborskii]MCZ2207526.1 hypothetical protein [Cylindrospermopsis raciborskii PAMP2011]
MQDSPSSKNLSILSGSPCTAQYATVVYAWFFAGIIHGAIA